jgi:hypothetical protein
MKPTWVFAFRLEPGAFDLMVAVPAIAVEVRRNTSRASSV